MSCALRVSVHPEKRDVISAFPKFFFQAGLGFGLYTVISSILWEGSKPNPFSMALEFE